MTERTAPETIRWQGDCGGHLVLLDQTRLPGEVVYRECRDVEAVWQAIRELCVRGAPAIGIAAAYGTVLGTQGTAAGKEEAFLDRLSEVAEYLAGSRPTAVNLFWALERIQNKAASLRGAASPVEIHQALLAEARAIHEEDRQMCAAIGRHGAALLAEGAGVLTHCNTGSLATGGTGTALAVIVEAHLQNRRPLVYVDETRPLLQGARLTAWELLQWEIPATLICDSAAAQVLREGRVQAVITGADRIAANGDVANKIGTYSLAVLARAHGVPFYVAAPTSTFDLSLASGAGIPIEQRAAEEVTAGLGRATAPAEVAVYNPAFDVTPAELVTAIVTEKGVIQPVTTESVAEMAGSGPEN